MKKKALGYEFLTGERRDGQLLYVPLQKCLFVKKSTTKNWTDYICYQTILVKNKKTNANKTIPCCTSRVQINSSGICTAKTKAHEQHENHELIYRDMKSKNAYIDQVIHIGEHLDDLPIEVSNRDLFTRELSK